MRVDNCFICSRPVYPSKGISFVRNDAKSFRFCRSKCHHAFKMKRQPRKLKWTKISRANAGKEMVVDSTLQFAAHRNVPTRYDRNLWAHTINAMERVEKIRTRRERAFYKKRMAGNKARNLAEDRKLVAENQHLLPPTLREGHEQAVEADVLPAIREARKSKVMGVERRRLKKRVDGGEEEDTEERNEMDID